jgi:AraC-like DNA-binding protein
LVGYESDAAFSKAFKRVVGVNPGEYLKRGI